MPLPPRHTENRPAREGREFSCRRPQIDVVVSGTSKKNHLDAQNLQLVDDVLGNRR